jgi:hypothetical protein
MVITAIAHSVSSTLISTKLEKPLETSTESDARDSGFRFAGAARASAANMQFTTHGNSIYFPVGANGR